MASRIAPGETIVPSLLDRLLDDEPEARADRPASSAQKLRDLRASVLRDVANVLNTRRRWPPPADPEGLVPSAVDYGIPDVTGVDLSTPDAREEFRAEVERTLLRYEPRFKSVRVTLLPDPDGISRTVDFRIEAVVHADPVPEQLSFRSEVDSTDGSVEVRS